MRYLQVCRIYKKLLIILFILCAVLPCVFAQQQPGKTGINSAAPATGAGTESGSLNPVQAIINNNGIHLKGRFFMAEGSGRFPTAILLYGFPGSETDMLGIGAKLKNAGFNALQFNYSGTFKSEGEFNWPNTQKDIEAAINFVHQPENIAKFNIDTSRIILGGHSFGGGMALTYAVSHPEIKEIFSISGNDHGEFNRNYQRDAELRNTIDEIFDGYKSRPDMIRFGPGGTPKEILEMKILDSNPTYDLRYCATLLKAKNILLIGAWDDLQVSIETIVLPLYRALEKTKANNVKIIALQDDHMYRKSRDELAQIIIDWIKSDGKK